jgi:hypothetical protein
MPASSSVLFGYQFKSIAALGPIVGPIVAVQWGWAPALLWLLLGVFFIGWVQDYSSIMLGVREEGQTFGALSYRLISPRSRIILITFIYFYLLLIAGAFGNVVVSTGANMVHDAINALGGNHYKGHWLMDDHFPKSVVAHGGVYVWKDGRENEDTFQALLDYLHARVVEATRRLGLRHVVVTSVTRDAYPAAAPKLSPAWFAREDA